ncbi:CNNM domain-containing protein [Psychroflexus aestuariivivens]|uniref:CNNM domain-containing protein n=1 Tax=Psychroflexus aestuariivivens TaxID=1795040 RepID=UPI000FD9C004|nr:CNNM domain-containing protein [Psychroflexus aestuariivivens]
MTLLILYLTLALGVSFLCSIMEAVLLSTPISFLQVKMEKGNASAKQFSLLKADIDRPLSAILSLNTIAHTVGAAGVGAQAAIVFGEAYFGLISAVLTLLILIVSEIIPKTIGAKYWRNIALFTGKIINFTVIIMYPLVWLSSLITNLIASENKEKTTSREEISALANIAEKEGVFSEEEKLIIQNSIKLRQLKAKHVMTPRIVVTVADENLLIDDFFEHKEDYKHSRIPIFEGHDENITGYVLRQHILENLVEEGQNTLKLKNLKRDILVFQENTPVFSIWKKMLEAEEHISLIVDEYGGLSGIITMEDILENLLGFEIIDEKDTVDNMQEYAKTLWNTKSKKFK